MHALTIEYHRYENYHISNYGYLQDVSFMENTTNQLLIETIIKQALKRTHDDPERSTRNLIDIGLNFSNGKFQRRFLELAQEMLQNEHSSYYRMIPDAISNITSNRIITFGMNIGYNSCTQGARKIRKIEASEGYNIPWCISLEIDGILYQQKKEHYHTLIQEGQTLGIYTWLIYALDDVNSLLELAETFQDCAFVFFCAPDQITNTLLDEATNVYNIMFAVTYTDGVTEACQLLRAHKMLYSIWYSYYQEDKELITNGTLLEDCEIMHPIFTILCATYSCDINLQKEIHTYIEHVRQQQIYQTFPFDLIHDNHTIDSIISDDPLTIHFDITGTCIPINSNYSGDAMNHFLYTLTDILKQVGSKNL